VCRDEGRRVESSTDVSGQDSSQPLGGNKKEEDQKSDEASGQASSLPGKSKDNDNLQALTEMFPTLKEETLRSILASCKGDIDKSIEELLKIPQDEIDVKKRPPTGSGGVSVSDGMDPLENSLDGNPDTIHSGELNQLLQWCASKQIDPRFQAVQALADLSAHPQNQVKIVEGGGVPALIKLAQLEQPLEVQKCATAALANLALDDRNQPVMLKEKTCPVLCKLLGAKSNPVVQEQACRAVANICYQSCDVELTLLKEGALESLIALVQSPVSSLQCEAIAALANLARNEDVQLKVLECKEWEVLFHMLRSPVEEIQRQAARTIGNLSIAETNKSKIVAAGCLKPLIYCLQMSASEDVVRVATMAVANLSTLESNRGTIVEEAGIELIIDLFGRSRDTKIQASRCLLHLLDGSDDQFKIEVVQSGVLVKLMVMARDDDSEVRFLAAKLIAILSQIKGAPNTW